VIDPRVAIIGAGPAGLSVALWLTNLRIPFAWFDPKGRVGGTLLRVGNPIHTQLAGRSFASGTELADALESQRVAAGLPAPAKTEVRSLRRTDAGAGWELLTTDAPARMFEHVVVATGTRPRSLGVPGEDALLGRGVEISVTRNLERYAGERVVVVGGGDAAAEGAVLLSNVCPEVSVVHRSSEWRAQSRFMDALRDAPNVSLLPNAEIARFIASDSQLLSSVVLTDGRELRAVGCFVRIGVQPAMPGVENSGPDVLALGDDGYCSVDGDGRTSLSGLWACGDLTGSAHQSVAWAGGQAARTAWALAQTMNGG
jgi:thioredoxin reductase (NADPH)